MDVLWEAGSELKPAEVKKLIKGNYAYTTIMTVLKRMADKKLVTRTLKGNAFYYKVILDKSDFAADCLDDLFYRLAESYGQDYTLRSFKKVFSKLGHQF
jgi:predicted transcriptional regulator